VPAQPAPRPPTLVGELAVVDAFGDESVDA
jgi:hypothetical protein